MASTIICQFNQLFSNSEKYPTSLEKHNVFLLIPSFIVILFVLFGGSVGAVVFLHTQYGWEAVKQVGSLRNKESRNTNWRKITVRSAWMRLNISNSVNSNRLFSIRKWFICLPARCSVRRWRGVWPSTGKRTGSPNSFGTGFRSVSKYLQRTCPNINRYKNVPPKNPCSPPSNAVVWQKTMVGRSGKRLVQLLNWEMKVKVARVQGHGASKH